MDASTRRAIQTLTRELQRTQAEVDTLRRATRRPQLGHSSIDTGSVEVRDTSGATRARIGWLPDGTVGMVTEGGDPPPAPTAPVVTPSLGGVRVAWDGALANDLALPGDFDHMAVHVSTTPGFVPSGDTYQGSIRRAGEGGMLPVVPLPYEEHYVVLVPVTTGGVHGSPSVEVAATPLRVDAPDLVAGSIDAAHIKAGAVEADKLESILVLASTIIAGVPGAARVELDQDGLRGYDTDNYLVFAVDSAGNAVFSGDIDASEITGSFISGSNILLGDRDGHHILMEAVLNQYQFVAAAGTGARVSIFTHPDEVLMSFDPPKDPQIPGSVSSAEIVARNVDTDGDKNPVLVVRSPGPSSGAYSQTELHGTTNAVPHTAMVRTYADTHMFHQAKETASDSGLVQVDEALSIRAPAHAFQQTIMLAEPTGTTSGSGDWNAFTEAQFPAREFRTGMSGRVRITISMCGVNPASDNSSLSTSFRLTGGPSVVEPSLHRCAFVRSAGTDVRLSQQTTSIVYLQLEGDTSYTLTPYWRTSGSTPWGGGDQYYDLSLDNSITVENLM